ncbi:Glycosyltransferase involved in cell wall biogenesis [Treponema sp. JC4]|uniref:glycosyltransferase n=1 Tax=Treponema sp. JC4 TaxID=1124982 RepID=UPI00025B0CF7|nr:glycosyltransferase [Treponema sp. JC4]EID83892.1 Glycosyltransferase involved in cell wall biogenesis [Treponema sp. JC4]
MISVAMATYNGEKHLNEQIDSILNQTLKVDEIVITDDNSSDKTVDILDKI